ncbi:MAG: FUSC family protein [Streptosporangiaceae bacterium]
MSGEPRSAIAVWFRSSRRMLAAELSQGGWLSFGAFRWADINIPRALRAGAGMITPLALGLATGHLEYGVFASLGALPAGMVSFQGESWTRVSAVAFAAFGMAVATFVGAVAAGTSGWLLFPAVLIFSYLAGLMASLGQRFLVVGLQWAIQLVIASAVPLPPREAGVRALLVLAGGLWQGALVVVSWAFTRGNQERASLAGAYRALGAYAAEACRRPAASDPAPPPAVFGSDAVHDPNPLLRAQERYRFLLILEQAERIRTSLAALASYGPECGVLDPVAGVLTGLADALEARRGHRDLADALRERLTAIDVPSDVPWRWAVAGLLGEIRGAVRILRRLDQRDTEPAPDPIPGPGPRLGTRLGTWRSNVAAAMQALRTSAGTSTEVGRHALRLAVVASIGEIVAQASGLPRGYWIVLTILIVLRPDYASTIYRGVQRAGGTVLGAGLGIATALLLHVGPAALVAAVGVTMTIAYAIFAVNYLLFAVFLTDFVVTLMALLGETAEQTVTARLAGTGIGAALALIGYLAWPSWEGESAQQKLARLFETQSHYAALVLRAYVRPGAAGGAPSLPELQSAGRAARRARSDAEASADRLADEPSRPPMTARLAYALTGIARRMAHASLTLQAAIEVAHTAAHGHPSISARPRVLAGADGGSGTGGAESGTGGAEVAEVVDQFADGVENAARVIAGSLRSLRPPGDMPPLRERQTAIYEQLTGAAMAAPAKGTAEAAVAAALAGPPEVLTGSTDEFTDALDTAADVLHRRLNG